MRLAHLSVRVRYSGPLVDSGPGRKAGICFPFCVRSLPLVYGLPGRCIFSIVDTTTGGTASLLWSSRVQSAFMSVGLDHRHTVCGCACALIHRFVIGSVC